MKTPIIKIGNSRGLRLSKTILERYNIRDSVELILQEEQIILKPVDEPRKGWETAFRKMRSANDDKLLMDDIFQDEDFD